MKDFQASGETSSKLKRHPELQNIKISTFFFFGGGAMFVSLDPEKSKDPTESG
jgi:hypothetical protein